MIDSILELEFGAPIFLEMRKREGGGGGGALFEEFKHMDHCYLYCRHFTLRPLHITCMYSIGMFDTFSSLVCILKFGLG